LAAPGTLWRQVCMGEQTVMPALTTFAEPPAASRPRRVPALERARGEARVAFRFDGGTRLVENFQSGCAKVRFPTVFGDAPAEIVLLNTAGGLTGGDRVSFTVTAEARTRVSVSTQAAERIYRALEGDAEVTTRLTAAAGASLDWLPQETILFDRSALRRRLDADVHPSARLLAAEAIVLGRAAMGESVRSVRLHDTWRVRRGGRLVFADGLRVDGDSVTLLSGQSTGAGAAALATVLLVAPDAEASLERARAALADADCEAGVSAWNGMLVARLLAADGYALRATLTRLIETLRGGTMPRTWTC